MPKMQHVMYPEHGGEPQKRPPLVVPMDNKLKMAQAYCDYLLTELTLSDDQGRAKWSGAQKGLLKRLLANWTLKALGKDAHYMKHGTFRRPFDSEPVGIMDIMAEMSRRRSMDRGEWVSNKAHREKYQSDFPHRVVRRWRKQFGTKTIEKSQE